jgi:hypothetical protein
MSEREPLAGLVELGAAVGELGASLAHAQQRMDEASLDAAVEMVENYRRSLADAAGQQAAERALDLVRGRAAFYSLPRIDVTLESALSVTRGRTGLIQMLLGGARSSTEETASSVRVTLAAVPAGEDLEELIRARSLRLQRALQRYLEERGLFGAQREGALRAYGLVEGEVRPAAPTGWWSDEDWRVNLRAFKQVWNREARQAADETALLPESAAPDRLSLAVLGQLAGGLPEEEPREALESEARILLAALSGDNAVHDVRSYPRGAWNGAWGELHAGAMRELGLSGAGDHPTPETVRALRRAWESGRKKLRPP